MIPIKELKEMKQDELFGYIGYLEEVKQDYEELKNRLRNTVRLLDEMH